MNSKELMQWLKDRGCTFRTHRGGSGHVTAKLGDRSTQIPMHGSRKELSTGLVNRIKKDLGLK
jgi:mRNA interferase HicA